jgi:hypothetical protein
MIVGQKVNEMANGAKNKMVNSIFGTIGVAERSKSHQRSLAIEEGPLGDDPNDFDDLGMAEMILEDIYIALYKAERAQSAQKLRDKVTEAISRGNALESYRRDIRHKSFWQSEPKELHEPSESGDEMV